MNRRRVAGTAGLLLSALLMPNCGKKPASSAPLPAVTVARPVQQRVAEYLDLTGTVAPSQTVDLVARVSGYLRSVNFEEGSWVEAGQLLFVIEPDQYEQQVRLTKAALLRAQSEYDRQVQLSKDNATSVATLEKWLSERDQASAQVELAQLNLSYTRVTAPFTGRIGRRYVDPGNLVGPGPNSKLATLDQIVPIYVNFNMNERDALEIRDAMRQRGYGSRPEPGRVPVLVGLQHQSDYPYEGRLDFVDIGLSTSSGTMLLRATLTNQDRALLPGFFARVRIPLGQPQPMFVLPNSALGNDQEGDYVLVVQEGDLVARRSVVKGPLTATGRAIRSGITGADRVVVNGLMSARPGAKVSVVEASASPAGVVSKSAAISSPAPGAM